MYIYIIETKAKDIYGRNKLEGEKPFFYLEFLKIPPNF